MKKLMIAALMLLGASTAFAGDSDQLKAILKADTYETAESLLKANLGQLASNAERAKAYNRLYTLAMEDANKQESIMIANQTAQQMGQKGDKPVDEAAMYKAVGRAFEAAEECYKYDQMPNEKGKVKPRFASVADELYPQRAYLINGGVYFQENKDDANAYKYLAQYVETAELPMFAKFDKSQDQNLTNIAYFATIYAYQNKDWAKAEKFVAYAMKDPERAKESQNLQFAIMGAQLHNHADSLAFVKKLENMYAQDNNNDDVLNILASTQEQLGNLDAATKLIDARLATDPENLVGNTLKGDLEYRAHNWDNAITYLDKALSKAPDDRKIVINSVIGASYIQKAQDRINKISGALAPAAKQQFDVVYKKAIKYLEDAKALDKTYQYKQNWAYTLYNAYYFVYGENDPKTQEAAVDAGINK